MSAAIDKKTLSIRHRIARAAGIAGRPVDEIKILAVSKTRPLNDIINAYQGGQRMFGESRVQELADKAAAAPTDIEWHLIGHLQKNKVRQAVLCAQWIHSVDSIDLIQRINRIADEENRCPVILIQVNISGENGKFGLPPESAATAVKTALSCPHVLLSGLMTIAPYGIGHDALRHIFRGLRELRDSLERQFGHPLPELSMGMSSDFELAITEGATIVRIGSAIFGERD